MALPADTVLSTSQLNVLFQELTLELVGLGDELAAYKAYLAAVEAGTWNDDDPVPPNPYYFVRVSWPTTGAPSWQLNETVAFLRIIEADDPYNRQRERKHSQEAGDGHEDDSDQATRFTRVIEASWVIYGPSSFDYAQDIRDKIHYQANHDTLARSNLFIIPDIRAPQRAPELFQGQWWERVDLSMRFNELVTRHAEVPWITSADITIKAHHPPATAIEQAADVDTQTATHPERSA